jgi:hypothetical protein
LMVLEIVLRDLLHMVVLSLLTRLRRKMISLSFHVNLNYLNLPLMNKTNIWKIVIGAVSAALGYILNAIGL